MPLPRRPTSRQANTLETEYSRAVTDFIDSLNRKYEKLLRQLIVAGGVRFNSMRYNALDFDGFKKKLFSIKDQIAKVVAGPVLKRVRSAFSRVERKAIDKIKKEYRKAKFPIPETVFKAGEGIVEKAVEDNVALIGSIAEEHVASMEQAVLKAVEEGSNFDVIIDEVQSISKQGRAKAEFIAKDQIGKTLADVSEAKQRASGFPGYIWNATNDSKTRDTHAALDGTFQLWDKAPIIDGRPLHPGQDFGCRCEAVPAFEA